jgi:uncharacterized coiled-coil DUF342 family protein
MSEPRPPIHPTENDWPTPHRDYHNEIRDERDRLHAEIEQITFRKAECEKVRDAAFDRAEAAERKLAMAIDAMRFVNTTFENDLAQGYVTKDKKFAAEILGNALTAISDA